LALESALSYLVEVLMIIPAVMVILGVFTVFVSREKVIKYLGEASGFRGVGLALLFGSLPTGPLYIAFPIAASLRNKGARVSNVVIFLSAWACIKMPQEMVELHFLGSSFMISRLLLTIFFVMIMGYVIERTVEYEWIRTVF
jgi:uncharacterized membrane protein YraQ (UPF0718 family)